MGLLLPHPPASTQLYKLGKGKLHDVVKLMANCLEQKGTMRAMSRGEYDGLVAANEPPPQFSPRRVLKNYSDMTTSEFQSHLIKLDTTFRGDKALNTGKRPPNTEDEFVHLQSRALMQLRKQLQDDQLQTESLLVSPSPTSDDRLRHQREHRELLVVQPRGPPEAATGLFRGLRASSRRAKDLDLLQRQRQGENSPGKLPGSHGSPRRGPGRVRDGVQPGHAAIRGRAQPPA